MNQTNVRKLARDLIKINGLTGWKVAFNGRVSSAGMCKFKTKTIFMSKKFITHTSDKYVLNTILHEIAHALDYERRETSDHGHNWVAICHNIGCDPYLKHHRDDLFEGKYDKWTYTCNGCGSSVGTSRRLKNMDKRRCAKCHSNFSEKKNL